MALKYIPRDREKPYTFSHRLAMCQYVANSEGSELGDILSQLCSAANGLHAFEDFRCEMILLIAENLSDSFVKGVLRNKQVDWSEYQEFDAEVYAHFTGGARKLTKEEYEG